jgi:hypothetical protein
MTVASSRHNRMLGNAIYDSDGLGIDLGTKGRTPNNPPRPTDGENSFQNYPATASANLPGTTLASAGCSTA